MGWWWGSVRLETLNDSELVAHIGRTALAEVEVTGPARASEFTIRVPVRMRRFDRTPLSEPARLELPPERNRAPPQGAVLEVIASVRAPKPPRSGGFDEAGYLRRQGVHVVLRAGSYRLVGHRGGIGGLADRLRHRIAETMAPGLSGERHAVIAGVVLGEDEGLSKELRDRFRASGLYHLLAVSGQNIAYVVGGVLLLAWVLGIPRLAAETVAIGAIVGYVMAVGWQPSVVRAGIAGALASLAWLASRPQDRWYFLLVGAAALLAWSPYTLLDAGFQLSFAAVAAIFVLVPRLARLLEGYPLPRGLAVIIVVSAACGVATAPILWVHFSAVPVYSILSNALAAPVVAPLLGLSLACAGIEPLVPEAARALAWVNGWFAAYLAGCARLTGGLPYAQVSSWHVLAGLAGAAAFIFLVSRLRTRRLVRGLALVAMALTLFVAWNGRPGEDPPPPPTGLRLTFIDVGQGDATLLQVPEGAVLVDQGPPEAGVADELRRLGVRELDALVLTHPQRDHVGGAAEILRRLEVGLVLDPGIPSENAEKQEALAEARNRDVPIALADSGQVYRLGRLRLRVLWPEGSRSSTGDPNDQAVVLLASYGTVDALLTADAESDITLPLRPPSAEILKVAHHGSADELLADSLRQVRPRIAIVSTGENDYGHPTPSTLATLEAFPGLAVYRTDQHGNVEIETDGLRLRVRTER